MRPHRWHLISTINWPVAVPAPATLNNSAPHSLQRTSTKSFAVIGLRLLAFGRLLQLSRRVHSYAHLVRLEKVGDAL